jgi:PAP2 superfamily
VNKPSDGQGRAPHGALPGLTRRDLVVRAGGALAGATSLGLLLAPATDGRRFPGVDQFDAEVATAWFDQALLLVKGTPGFSPPVASRAFGCTGLALYEALVPGMDGYRSFGSSLAGLGPLPTAGKNEAYDWPTLANAALAAILRGLFPPTQAAAISALEARFEDRFRSSRPPGVFARSIARGRAVAAAVYEWSKNDGGHEGYVNNFPLYQPPVGPSLWVPTPPAFLPALQPYWGRNRCLALTAGSDCPPADHPAYSEHPGSTFYAEALEAHETVATLSAEQETIARFWSDDPGTTPTPPGHSIAITTQVLRHERSSLAAAAEAYARVGMAVADAFVACWHQKYVSNLLRPVTYIRRLIDPQWLPILVTPPFPEYPSGHSVQSGAAFQVLTDLFGESYSFTDHTHDNRGFEPRSFDSFLEAAEEAAISRLYGGIHFRAAIANGVDQGRCIGLAVSAVPLRA